MDNIFVDSCVLLDIFNEDENFCDWSIQTLGQLCRTHNLVINPIIFTEIAFNFDSVDSLKKVIDSLNIEIINISLPAAFTVSRVLKKYKKNKGELKRPMPDFYIGAHAEDIKAGIVTRDPSKFKTYYPQVKLFTPTSI